MIREIDTHEHYAPAMRNRDRWIVHVGDKKPRAPWQGTLSLALWNSDLDDHRRPEVPFEKAKQWAERDGVVDDIPNPDDVGGLRVGYILPHDTDEYEQTITLVDLDDVRDPDTNEILDEAWELVQALDSYTEVSQSGEGVHIYVFGKLPEHIGNIVEPFDSDEEIVGETPKVEVYDHGRVSATTGRHIKSTPEEIREAQDVIDDIIDRYYDADETAEEVMQQRQPVDKDYDTSESSAYYDVDTADIVTMGKKWRQRGGKYRGPHPVHGSTNNDNTAINGKYWHCFRHDSGGVALHLVAVQEGMISCGESGRGSFEKLTDEEFAELCMKARDEYGFPAEEKPPYRALLGVAKAVNLCDDSDERLGELYDIALDLYQQNSWNQLT